MMPDNSFFQNYDEKISAEQVSYHLYNLDDNRVHFSYDEEFRLFSLIATEDSAEVEKTVHAFFLAEKYDVGMFACNEKKQLEYSMVMLLCLFCRAAIDTGANSGAVYDICDAFLYKISLSQTFHEYMELCSSIITESCRLIRQSCPQTAGSLHVQKCIRYVSRHLTQILRTQDLARELGLTPAYLSRLFHQYEGITLKVYIQRERVHAAANMLKYSDYTIPEIADRFRFPSLSYFCQVFKNHMGLTPSKYRNLYKPAAFQAKKLSRAFSDMREETRQIHFPYGKETDIFRCVLSGDFFAAHSQMHHFLEKQKDDVSPCPLSWAKRVEYWTVMSICLICRYAINAGVDPLESYDRSDLYLQKLSSASSPKEQADILDHVIYGYCRLIEKAHTQSVSSLHIRNCIQYISQHLVKPFRITDMADDLGLSPTYLSGLFRRDKGITLKAYILQERISAASNMLKYSDYSIQEISDRFCFPSASYFCQAFKKHTGLTPSKYRVAYRPKDFWLE